MEIPHTSMGCENIESDRFKTIPGGNKMFYRRLLLVRNFFKEKINNIFCLRFNYFDKFLYGITNVSEFIFGEELYV